MIKITEAMVEAAWQAFGDCPIDMCGDHDEEQKKCVVAAVEAALSAGQAQPVAIKPLRWKGPDGHGEYHSLDGMWGYIIRAETGEGFWLTEIGRYYPSIETAETAAQQDYETRIRSALVPPAVPGEVVSENAKLVELIRTRFLGVHPDELDCYLEYDDWTRIIAALSVPLPEIEGGDIAWESPEEWAIEQRAFHAAGRDDVPADVQQLVAKLWAMYCHAAAPSASIEGETP